MTRVSPTLSLLVILVSANAIWILQIAMRLFFCYIAALSMHIFSLVHLMLKNSMEYWIWKLQHIWIWTCLLLKHNLLLLLHILVRCPYFVCFYWRHCKVTIGVAGLLLPVTTYSWINEKCWRGNMIVLVYAYFCCTGSIVTPLSPTEYHASVEFVNISIIGVAGDNH